MTLKSVGPFVKCVETRREPKILQFLRQFTRSDIGSLYVDFLAPVFKYTIMMLHLPNLFFLCNQRQSDSALMFTVLIQKKLESSLILFALAILT